MSRDSGPTAALLFLSRRLGIFGSVYRPYLTSRSHPIATPVQRIRPHTPWESTLCYSRVVRIGPLVAVSQTSAVDGQGCIAGGDDPYAQAVQALANVVKALEAVGAQLGDVVRTRIFLARFTDLAAVARAHAELFRDGPPAISIQTCPMVDSRILVEFEVDAYMAR